MNKLLDCPFCGEKPIYEAGKSVGSPSEPDEYYQNIYCGNPACIPFEELESWNSRVNKEAEFLEELKEFALYSERLDEFGSTVISSVELIIKIKQFQAEQKAADENA